MKILQLLTIAIITITLSACKLLDTTELEYEDFAEYALTSHYEAETMSNNRYIVYYYGEYCTPCNNVKQDILSFFNDFELLDFYLFETGQARDLSSLIEFEGTPTIFVFSDNQVLERYLGLTEVENFISKYKNMELDYDTFDSQHITTYQDVLDIENDTYILYYYLEGCPYCNMIKEDFLKFAFTKSAEDIYFMNGANVIDPDNIPTELSILNSGTPILVLMSNGEFTNEYYSGYADVLAYIIEVGSNDITTNTLNE